ncbi:MAG: DoxX family protein [Candidatus Obscuribacter sp.]|nr:DoxX family protein [Candidatus Obscuribacter sp.]MBK9202871.1 DoxX family protein [Candidatus Obscuribacter sp.]MBK9621035.1 DoxX family protein [Candidatus Obscuribacter sp.]MBK9771495.1 DoxX family protein [Candidatus Obscuribacter sp.]MBL0185471.1 DoxX family protein [Candidatus Obscuribacter sp.]
MQMQILKIYREFCKFSNYLQPLVLLVFRLTWGWQFFLSGKGKLLNHNNVSEFFTSLGIPFPELNAWVVGGVECIGGLLLLAGLASRPVGLILSLTMTVAYLSVEDDRTKVINVFKDMTPFLTADPFFFWLTAVITLAFGAGPLSLDWLIERFFIKDKAGSGKPAYDGTSQ